MPKQETFVPKSGTGNRPWMARIYGERDFVAMAIRLGFDATSAAAVWQRMYNAVKSVRHNQASTLSHYLVKAQVIRYVAGRRQTAGGLEGPQGELLLRTARQLGITS